MTDILSSLGYVTVFVSTFCCIVYGLIRWNNTEATVPEQLSSERSVEEAGKTP